MADYTKLRGALDEAFKQSAEGKGRERHANGKDFERQPILEIGRMVGPGFQLGQVMKKAQEAASMIARGDYEAARTEILGAIVYSAATVVMLDETAKPAPRQSYAKPAFTEPVARAPLSEALRNVDRDLNGQG